MVVDHRLYVSWQSKGKYWLYQLIDIVSKNGTLLLNMGPNADGSWMEPWRDELFKMGEWLDQYGEAIYNTKPWHRFGEGDNFGGDSFTHVLGDNLTSNDIRFTRKGDTLYAIVCGWRTVPVHINALNSKDLKGLNVKSVELMGHKGGVKWQQNAEDLMVTFPEEKFGDYAYVLKIKGDNMFPEREEYVEMEIPFGADSLKNVSQVRVVAKGSNKQMAVAEIAVVADTKPTKLHNITTLSGELFSSSVEDGMVAERAGDNNMCGNVYAGSVAMTKSSKDPYIGVKFQQPKSLFGVIVYPEMNSREKMMREASLQCLDASGKVIYDKPFKGIVADPATKVIIP